MLYLCHRGCWVVVPYEAVQFLPNVLISPLGVFPQRYRRPWLIVDYTYSVVNAETVPLVPRKAMQFGSVLQLICSAMVQADPRYRPMCMPKVDTADGFHRVVLNIDNIPKLGVAFLAYPTWWFLSVGGVPLALPMGWEESPPTSRSSSRRRAI